MATIILAPYVAISKFVMWVTLPYIVLAYGLSRSWLGSFVNKVGDCSYGVYIYAFPVQQFVLLQYPDIAYGTYLAVTVLMSLVLGYGSWHLIEKRMLKFKPKGKGPLAVKLSDKNEVKGALISDDLKSTSSTN